MNQIHYKIHNHQNNEEIKREKATTKSYLHPVGETENKAGKIQWCEPLERNTTQSMSNEQQTNTQFYVGAATSCVHETKTLYLAIGESCSKNCAQKTNTLFS